MVVLQNFILLLLVTGNALADGTDKQKGDCLTLITKCQAEGLTRDDVEDCQDKIKETCKGIDTDNDPLTMKFQTYSTKVSTVLTNLNSQHDTAPAAIGGDGEYALAYTKKLNLCKTSIGWGYFTNKAPPKQGITCDRCTNEGDPKFQGGYKSQDDCDAARLADKNVQTINGVNRCTQYIGTNQQATVMAADFMFEREFGVKAKETAYFSSSKVCTEVTKKPFKAHADYQPLTVHPMGATGKNRVIKPCYKTTFTVCRSGGDESVKEISFVK